MKNLTELEVAYLYFGVSEKWHTRQSLGVSFGHMMDALNHLQTQTKKPVMKLRIEALKMDMVRNAQEGSNARSA